MRKPIDTGINGLRSRQNDPAHTANERVSDDRVRSRLPASLKDTLVTVRQMVNDLGSSPEGKVELLGVVSVLDEFIEEKTGQDSDQDDQAAPDPLSGSFQLQKNTAPICAHSLTKPTSTGAGMSRRTRLPGQVQPRHG